MDSKPDFVIVGGGLAGLVVATRLTENPETTVVVLEAGKDHSSDPRIRTPAFWISLLGQDDFDWDYRSSEQVRMHRMDLAFGQRLTCVTMNRKASMARLFPSHRERCLADPAPLTERRL